MAALQLEPSQQTALSIEKLQLEISGTHLHVYVGRRGGGVVERATPEPKVLSLPWKLCFHISVRDMMATLAMENSTVAN